ncbi:MAG: DUF2191 domain-containing protein [Bryobacteraceae bacterium]
MRTTLSLDDDVAAQLEAWRAREDLSFKEAVNSALRRGLSELSRPKMRRPFRTKPIDMGPCRIPNLDNIWEVLDDVENEERPRR